MNYGKKSNVLKASFHIVVIVGVKPLQSIISSKAERSLLSWNKLMLKSPIKTTVSFVLKEDKMSFKFSLNSSILPLGGRYTTPMCTGCVLELIVIKRASISFVQIETASCCLKLMESCIIWLHHCLFSFRIIYFGRLMYIVEFYISPWWQDQHLFLRVLKPRNYG